MFICNPGVLQPIPVRGHLTRNLLSVPTAVPLPKYIPPSTVHTLAPSAHWHHQLVITSSPFHCPRHRHHSPVVPSPSFLLSAFLFSLSSLIFSQSYCLLHYSLLLWSHFYLSTPIYPHPYLYTLPFLAEIPIFSF